MVLIGLSIGTRNCIVTKCMHNELIRVFFGFWNAMMAGMMAGSALTTGG